MSKSGRAGLTRVSAGLIANSQPPAIEKVSRRAAIGGSKVKRAGASPSGSHGPIKAQCWGSRRPDSRMAAPPDSDRGRRISAGLHPAKSKHGAVSSFSALLLSHRPTSWPSELPIPFKAAPYERRRGAPEAWGVWRAQRTANLRNSRSPGHNSSRRCIRAENSPCTGWRRRTAAGAYRPSLGRADGGRSAIASADGTKA
jgi:hypothetical protein